MTEELQAAKAAKASIDEILIAVPKPKVIATLNKAKQAAVLNFSSGGKLNEARAKAGIALSNVIHAQPTNEKIEKAKAAIDDWIKELQAASP